MENSSGFLCSGGGLPLLQRPEFLWKLSWPFLACAGHLRKSFQRFIRCVYSCAEVRNDKLKRQTFRRGMVMVGQGDKIMQPTIGSMSSIKCGRSTDLNVCKTCTLQMNSYTLITKGYRTRCSTWMDMAGWNKSVFFSERSAIAKLIKLRHMW